MTSRRVPRFLQASLFLLLFSSSGPWGGTEEPSKIGEIRKPVPPLLASSRIKDAQLVAKVGSSDIELGDYFGNSVSVSSDIMIVGAPYDNYESGDEPGSAYIFARDYGGVLGSWGEVTKLEPPDAEHLDRYGWAVAVSGDTAVVGSIWDDDNGFSSGSAYIYSRNQGGADNWGLVKKITPSDGVELARFGISVAISGNTLAVGAEDWEGTTESAYVFERHHGGPDNWGEVARVVASDGSGEDARFAIDIALDGEYLVVGAPGHDGLGEDAGAAYIFGRHVGGANAWGEVARITSPDAEAFELFGNSVAIDGDRLLIGETWDGGAGVEYGAAHVFGRNSGGGDTWGHVMKLVPPQRQVRAWFGSSVTFADDLAIVTARLEDVGEENTGAAHVFAVNNGGVENWGYLGLIVPGDGQRHDEFGNDVSADGNTVAVGSHQNSGFIGGSGAAYVFWMNDSAWKPTAKRTASDGAAYDYFGTELALGGDTLVVAAERQGDGGTYAGAAYIFERDLGGIDEWEERKKITPSDSGQQQFFGEAVAIDRGIAVVGAVPEYVPGAAYVFYRNRGGADAWGEVKKITADDGVVGARFGDSVALDGNTLVVGAYDDAEEAEGAGAAYVFERNAGGLDNWGQVAKLTAGSEAGVNFYFGWSVGVQGDLVVATAVGDDDDGYLTGAAYVFSRNLGGANSWGRLARLTASDASSNDWYGAAVAIDGDTIAVGAHLAGGRGAVYIYNRNQGGAENWGEIQQLRAPSSTYSTRFGASLVLEGDTLVIGDWAYSLNGYQSGSVHVRSRNAGGPENWGEILQIIPNDNETGDNFGHGPGLSGNNLAVGAYTDDDAGTNSGSVYLYRLAGPEADLAVEMISDVSAVLPGSTMTLTATISNAGPQAADAAVVDVAFDPAAVDSSAVTWICLPGVGATEGTTCPASGVGSTLETGVDVGLNPGESVIFEMTVPVLGSASGDVETITTARPPSYTADPDGSNNMGFRAVAISELDFGDAPDPAYATLLASNGARHVITSGLFLGATVDGEIDGQPTTAVDGDDADGSDDEDGVIFTTDLVPGFPAGVAITASTNGLVDAWIDFNGDGDWSDPGERVFTGESVSAGINVLEIQTPPEAVLGVTVARFRLSTEGSLSFTGLAADGEVEDHLVLIVGQLPPEIFDDGFETGDTSHWSQTVGSPPVEIFSDGFESGDSGRWDHNVQ